MACRPTPASGFVLISESRVHQLTSGFCACIHSQHTWMGFGWDKEKLGREVGKNLVPLEQRLANDSSWCKYFHRNTDGSFVCIISVAVLTYTGKGGVPQKTCGPQGLKLLLSGPLKKCLPTPALETKKKKRAFRKRQTLAEGLKIVLHIWLISLSWGDTVYFKRNQVKSKPSTGMPFYSIYLFGCGRSLLWHMGLLGVACGI